MNKVLLVCMLALALCAGAHAALPRRQLAQSDAGQCRALFNQVGGVDALARFMPACTPSAYNAQQCCRQAKSALSLAPQAGQCLCNAEVWKEVSSQAGGAGFGSALTEFQGVCDIKVSGRGC